MATYRVHNGRLPPEQMIVTALRRLARTRARGGSKADSDCGRERRMRDRGASCGDVYALKDHGVYAIEMLVVRGLF